MTLAAADARKSVRLRRSTLAAGDVGSEAEPVAAAVDVVAVVVAAVAEIGDVGPPGLGDVATVLRRLRRLQPKPVDGQKPDRYLRPESSLHRPAESYTDASAIGLVGRSLP